MGKIRFLTKTQLETKSDSASTAILVSLSEGVTIDGIDGRFGIDSLVPQVIEQIAQLNKQYASLEWWCFDLSAKNILSSRLVNLTLGVLAVVEVAIANKDREIQVVGWSNAQKFSILAHLMGRAQPHNMLIHLLMLRARALFKSSFQLLRALLAFGLKRQTPTRAFDLAFISYADGSASSGADPYFGNLADDLVEQDPDLSIAFLTYYYTPFRKRLAEFSAELDYENIPLFNFLRLGDYFWAFGRILRIALAKRLNRHSFSVADIDLSGVLWETMLSELGDGYSYYLLVYRAITVAAKNELSATYVYPFENKSIEKCILLALREHSQAHTIGYQHTSVSNRHFGYMLLEEELEITPMPARIVTLGSVTAQWLISHSSINEEKIRVGYAARQNISRSKLRTRDIEVPLNLLLALSSSKAELVRALEYVRELKSLKPELNVAVRTHPNFPLEILGREILDWAQQHTRDATRESLKENLQWSDAVLFVSSTVALEAQACGIPVIRLALDSFDSDPLLGNSEFSWEVNTPTECIAVLKRILTMDNSELMIKRETVSKYIQQYFEVKSKEAVRQFLP